MVEEFSQKAYDALLEELFRRYPSFGSNGAAAYKPGLEREEEFCHLLGDPQKKLRCIHVAGTNGKGSTCNMLAAHFASKGLRVGLYTSPHILDFRERMRVIAPTSPACRKESEGSGNCPERMRVIAPTSPACRKESEGSGNCPERDKGLSSLISREEGAQNCGASLISREEVWDFLTRWGGTIDSLGLSLFEITTAMAFDYFERAGVDIAVIETGLGGRLDATNIITPELSVITNIGYDHMNLLGDTLAEIAGEKAGIIKAGVPVVIGESGEQTDGVFLAAARHLGCPIVFADKTAVIPGSGIFGKSISGAGISGEGISGADIPLENPEKGIPGKNVSGEGILGKGISGADSPLENPENGISGESIPGKGISGVDSPLKNPEKGIFGESIPEKGISGVDSPLKNPENGISGESIPGKGILGKDIPGADIPGAGILREMDLQGIYQEKNLRTVCCALDVLGEAPRLKAIENAARICDFHGRWEKVSDKPVTICDIGHNAHGLKYNFQQLNDLLDSGEYSDLVMVYGSVSDKDVDSVLRILPRRAHIFFTAAHSPRALGADELMAKAIASLDSANVNAVPRPFPETVATHASSPETVATHASSPETGSISSSFPETSTILDPSPEAVAVPRPQDRWRAVSGVANAVIEARKLCETLPRPLLYIGGSTYIVSEALRCI